MTTNIGTGAVLITGPTSGLGRALTLKLAGKCRMRQVLVQQLGPQGLGERVWSGPGPPAPRRGRACARHNAGSGTAAPMTAPARRGRGVRGSPRRRHPGRREGPQRRPLFPAGPACRPFGANSWISAPFTCPMIRSFPSRRRAGPCGARARRARRRRRRCSRRPGAARSSARTRPGSSGSTQERRPCPRGRSSSVIPIPSSRSTTSSSPVAPNSGPKPARSATVA